MSEENAVADPVDALPEASQMDFSSALDAAFANLDLPKDEATADPVEEAETETETEVAETEETTEVESESAEELESFDPTDELGEDVGDDWTPKAAARFKQLKTELKTVTSELEGLRQSSTEKDSKVKELSGEIDREEVSALKEKLQEYERAKMFTDLEETDIYKDAVTKPIDALIDSSRQIAEKYDVSPDDLVDVLAMDNQQEQDEKISELLVDASDRDKARIYRIIEDLAPILEKRGSMLENAGEALGEAKLAAENKENALAADRAAERTNAARNVVARVQKKLPFLSGIEGLDMKAIQEKAAEVDPSVIHPVDYTYNSVSAQILPSVIREYVGMRKENELLTDRLAEYEDAEPTMSGSAPSSGGGYTAKASFSEAVDAAFAGM
jgi:hypothetical protein|tara:strand:- start:4248 stop:5405 length:1158 start_codon:yes stop_codon:yes gene_type:complete